MAQEKGRKDGEGEGEEHPWTFLVWSRGKNDTKKGEP